MMKKLILFLSICLLSATSAFSQNIQMHYDLGSLIYQKDAFLAARPTHTTTVEMFRPDSWGSTFFFVDMNYVTDSKQGTRGVNAAYWEISRDIKHWDLPLSVHLEYNGGLHRGIIFTPAYHLGSSYTYVSKDFKKIFSLTATLRFMPTISDQVPEALRSKIETKYMFNPQLATFWSLSLWKDRVTVTGFAKLYTELKTFFNNSYVCFLSQPQFWYNLNTIEGWKGVNLSLGTEVELSYNIAYKGFYAIPTVAMKWTF